MVPPLQLSPGAGTLGSVTQGGISNKNAARRARTPAGKAEGKGKGKDQDKGKSKSSLQFVDLAGQVRSKTPPPTVNQLPYRNVPGNRSSAKQNLQASAPCSAASTRKGTAFAPWPSVPASFAPPGSVPNNACGKGAAQGGNGTSGGAVISPTSCFSHYPVSPALQSVSASSGSAGQGQVAPSQQVPEEPRAPPSFQSTASQRSSRSAPAPVPCTPAGCGNNPTTIDALLGDWQSCTDQAVAKSQQTIQVNLQQTVHSLVKALDENTQRQMAQQNKSFRTTRVPSIALKLQFRLFRPGAKEDLVVVAGVVLLMAGIASGTLMRTPQLPGSTRTT